MEQTIRLRLSELLVELKTYTGLGNFHMIRHTQNRLYENFKYLRILRGEDFPKCTQYHIDALAEKYKIKAIEG
jgi:hypothetical protein